MPNGERVKIYSRDIGDTENHVVFKYSDLINRAIAFKVANTSAVVEIKFAMYKLGQKSYVVFDPTHADYGTVAETDIAGSSSEKLIWSLVKAAKFKVNVDFLYHKDNLDSGCTHSDSVFDYLDSKLLDDTDASMGTIEDVGDYLTVTRVGWDYDAHLQMHAKFMTVSDYGTKSNSVYVTTSNIDDHDGTIPDGKDWVQTGILVNDSQGLYDAHNEYFEIIKDNASSHSGFMADVRTEHATDDLNYHDEYFSAYFFPIPLSPNGDYDPTEDDWDSDNATGWDVDYNPFSKYADSLTDVRDGGRYIKGNIYHIKWDNFTKAFRNCLETEYDNRNTAYTTSWKFLMSTNSNADDDSSNNTYNPTTCTSVKDDYEDGIQKIKDEFSGMGATIRNQNSNTIGSSKKTHSKDMIFAFSEIAEYYSITGSTNLKLDAVTSKANNSLVIKEYTTAHLIYNEFKLIFNYQY